jgi:uncharacterized protein YraI
MRIKASLLLTILTLLLASCNLPTGNEATPESSETPSVNALGTAVELTALARITELAGTAVASATEAPASLPTETSSPAPTATPCGPIVTASTVANIRTGPDTAYQVVGSLPENGVAKIAGRNDANTWWYIEFAGGVGGHAWIAGSVVTVSCVPDVVQVVAAPPFPTAAPTATLPPPVAGTPDLVADGMQWWPNPGKKNQPMSIQVKVTNNGSAPTGQFTVAWLSNQTEPGCSWTVSGLGVGESKNLDCEFTYTIQPASTSSFWITLVVDSNNQIAESDEGNNKREVQIKVEP